jgi:hypothetical protein
MEWDKVKMAQMFLARANGLHPEDAFDERERSEILAAQDLYYECYISSFSREKLFEYLDNVLAGKVKVPEEVEEKNYRDAIAIQAEKLKTELTNK